MKTTIVLRNESKATGLSTIYIEYSSYPKVKRFPTGIKIPKSYWNEETQRIKNKGTDNVNNDNTNLQEQQLKIERLIKDFFTENSRFPTTIELSNLYEATITDTPDSKNILDYVKEFKELKKPQIKLGTLKTFIQMENNLTDFYKVSKFPKTFEAIDFNFLEKYKLYFLNKKHSNSTISKKIRAFKEFLTYYNRIGINTNLAYKSFSYNPKQQKNKEVITLSVSELEAFKKLDLTQNPKLERVRDLFILQSWSGLRYGDVIRLNKSHIKNDTIKIDISKTEDISDIPLFREAKAILEKYDYQIRRISNDKYNEYLREVCKLVPELKVPITTYHISGTTKKEITKPKYDYIGTHTARRNFVTLMLDFGINPAQIMKWSNHSSLNMFKKYINTKQAEQTETQKVEAKFQELTKLTNKESIGKN